jgi:hypothetical protein
VQLSSFATLSKWLEQRSPPFEASFEAGIISADVKQFTGPRRIGLFTAPTVTAHPSEVDKMPDGNKIPDGNVALVLGNGTTCTDRQLDEAPQQDGPRPNESSNETPNESWAGPRPTIVETASLIQHSTGAGDGPVTGQVPHRRSHLARLVEAVQKSRRLQAERASRHILHLVQGERG